MSYYNRCSVIRNNNRLCKNYRQHGFLVCHKHNDFDGKFHMYFLGISSLIMMFVILYINLHQVPFKHEIELNWLQILAYHFNEYKMMTETKYLFFKNKVLVISQDYQHEIINKLNAFI